MGIRQTMEDVLYYEAMLLDRGRLEEWLELLSDQVRYRVPVRTTRERGEPGEFSPDIEYFDDNKQTLRLRVERYGTAFAWSENPPSRVRHFIGNVRVIEATADRVQLEYGLWLYRNRGDDPRGEMLSGERRDVWQKEGDRWRLVSREVLLDQTVVGLKNLSIFL